MPHDRVQVSNRRLPRHLERNSECEARAGSLGRIQSTVHWVRKFLLDFVLRIPRILRPCLISVGFEPNCRHSVSCDLHDLQQRLFSAKSSPQTDTRNEQYSEPLLQTKMPGEPKLPSTQIYKQQIKFLRIAKYIEKVARQGRAEQR
jgi:hypothetical protein